MPGDSEIIKELAPGATTFKPASRNDTTNMNFLNLQIPADSGFFKPETTESFRGRTLSDNAFKGLSVLKYFFKNFRFLFLLMN
jgi:hypothetical protein